MGHIEHLVEIITSPDAEVRNRSLDGFCGGLSAAELLAECARLEAFRQRSDNLYERVRACFFLYAIHRFHLPSRSETAASGRIPFKGYLFLLERRFEEAVSLFLAAQDEAGPSDTLSSALAVAYHRLGFQTLADQVRQSVRSVSGNRWMFRVSHPQDQPLRIRPELIPAGKFSRDFVAPVLKESTPVRMDLTHSAWSDIFFLGMDFPEAARVLNVSIDLGVHGRDVSPRPPVEAYLRMIDEPLLRLTSVDLATTADLTTLDEVFDFAKDYLGLLKAALIASGIVPPGIEGSEQSLSQLLESVVGPGRGLELVSNVNGIPKGSRLAVSTNLLASLIAVCMRATGQTRSLTGPLEEHERRTVAARAILGEWLAGSGGGWQDSGGVWPGIKLIEGERAVEGDAEFGISRGRLLPGHKVLRHDEISAAARAGLQQSLVLVHGGMAQNVGPVLEMVTEKYLLRSEKELNARMDALLILDEILGYLKAGDIAAVGAATTRNFFGPLQTIVPAASNLYTETIINEARQTFAADFWGFWMLGGMSGGGMGFIFAPERKQEAQSRLHEIMLAARRKFEHALPFAMEPVIYDFGVNENGTSAEFLQGANISLPSAYYAMTIPQLVRQQQSHLSPARRAELDAFGTACRTHPELGGMVQTLFDQLLPRDRSDRPSHDDLTELLDSNGFDAVQHEQIRSDLRRGRIGLAMNRLPVSSSITDVEAGDVTDGINNLTPQMRERGLAALAAGEVAIVTLAAGVGSRWTQGAGVVKALHPFAKLGNRHRTFIETHLAKSRRTAQAAGGTPLPHIFTTSYLTHAPVEEFLRRENNYDYEGPLVLSPGRAVGLRLVPTVRDLRFAWEEMPQQMLDEQAQKVRRSLQTALINWAQEAGEASDYTENVPSQCLHPVGHWYEVPNMLRNGVLKNLLDEFPRLQHLMIHNIDTLGADADPALLGLHLASQAGMTIEVITRRIEDRGGGLARVNGKLRLVEGLAMPKEEAEFDLTYYNSATTWVNINALLDVFGLTRESLSDEVRVTEAIRKLAARMPTYITLKDVKRRWGYGQEDIFPVAQFEKLWGDMTALPELDCRYVLVPRMRGQQLKEQAQLDAWLRDGSAAFVESLCALR